MSEFPENIEGIEEALAAFRSSVRQWSADEFAAARPSRRAYNPAWSMAAILLVSLLGLRLSLQPRPAEQTVVSSDADTELMEQVRADLARPVPRGMEPWLTAFSGADSTQGEMLP